MRRQPGHADSHTVVRLALPASHRYSGTVSKDQNESAAGDFLVIGYGNTLRSDDGVGAKVAASVAELTLPGVVALVLHQLTPELAEPISEARAVVFVDAAVDASTEVQMRQLAPAEGAQLMAHAADPRSLLAFAQQLFGRCPPAWWLTIPVENLAFGEELSPLARRGFQTALEKIQTLAGGI
jgi:hydrogenase maturation protease